MAAKMRQLREADRKEIFEYVGKEPDMNLFFYGNTEKYGIDSDEVRIFGLEEENGWDCMLMQYYDDYSIYSQKETYDVQAVAEFLAGRRVDCIRGKTSLVRPFQFFYPERYLKENFFCRCDRSRWAQRDISGKEKNRWDGQNTVEIRRLYAEDTSEMMRVYLASPEFAKTFQYPERSEQQMKRELIQGETAVGVYENGILVSVARTGGSSSLGAMVVCVATDPDYRQRGYGSLVVRALCKGAFDAGKQFLCLYYSNPAAGRIYQKIGFEEIGHYAMLR